MNRVYLEKTATPVWLYYFVGIIQLPILVIYLTNMYADVNFESSVDGALIGISVFVLLMFAGIYWMMASIKLELRIADRTLTYRFPPFVRKARSYSFDEIESWEVVKKSPLSMGIGWRFDPSSKSKVYSTGGDHALSLKFTSGKRLMLSTRKPEELRKMMEMAKSQDYE